MMTGRYRQFAGGQAESLKVIWPPVRVDCRLIGVKLVKHLSTFAFGFPPEVIVKDACLAP
jgi:hypothetical protein